MQSISLLGIFLLVFTQYSTAQYFCAGRPATELDRQKAASNNDSHKRAHADVRKVGTVLEIPVIFHVIHHDSSTIGQDGNHADSTIFAVLDSVNDILAHTSGAEFDNPFSGIDIGIKLVVAKQDPEGNPTTGIVRYADSVYSVVYEGSNVGAIRDSTQIKYHWPVEDYLNVYLVHILDVNGTQRSGVVIYYFGDGSDIPDYDGIVLSQKGFANASIFAHELGHYLSLFHTFESWDCKNDNCEVDGDQICDTPPKQSSTDNGALACVANDDCTSDEDDVDVRNPFRPIDIGGLGNQPDGIENYMDYVLDCHGAFTEGQKDRMRAYLLSSRGAILTSPALDELVTSINDMEATDFSIYPNPTKDVLHISLNGNQNLKNVKIYNADMRLVLQSGSFEFSTSQLANGVYIIKVSTDEEVLIDTFVKY